MTVPLIKAEGLGLSFDGRQVLHGVNFAINPGEIVTIVGPNGSGKSSFLKCLIGAIRPTEGRLERKPGLRIGYVPQKLHLDQAFPMTVTRFLRLAGKTGLSDRMAFLAKVGQPEAANWQTSDLYGGQLQRVLLAYNLIGKPDLLVLEEAA